MPQTLAEKIATRHAVGLKPGQVVHAGDFLSIRPKHVMTHDNTSAVMGKFTTIMGDGAKVHDPRQPVFAIDHDIQNTTPENLGKYAKIQTFAERQGIDFYPAGTGICHQVMVEQGYVTPGSMVVGSDSHSNLYGAASCLGTPVVRTDAACIWATGETWWQVPPIARVELQGRLQPGVVGKDVIIALCGLFNNDEVLNHLVEFAGDGVACLSMDQRMSIANMTTEWGALAGIFPFDEVLRDYLHGRADHLDRRGTRRYTRDDVGRWWASRLEADGDAFYPLELTIDLATVIPHVSGPDHVKVMHALPEIEKQRIRIDKAYLLSCVNARLEDLAEAARIVEGKHVAEGVEFYVAAASAEVQKQAEDAGYWKSLVGAGAIPLPSGCGPCIGMGRGTLEPGEVCISATNRNFKGRMGSRDAKAYLGSPAVVAASAVAGYIKSPVAFESTETRHSAIAAQRPAEEADTEIVEGFPARVTGRALLLPIDNLNTDGIYAGTLTYRDDVTPAEMAAASMANYDPAFNEIAREGDIMVAGRNFGTGSSREQAATCLAHRGIRCVIAASISQTYQRNAFNNGFLVLESPALYKTLRERLAGTGTPTVPGPELTIDFSRSTISTGDASFGFGALSTVAQELIVAGGAENVVRARRSDEATKRRREEAGIDRCVGDSRIAAGVRTTTLRRSPPAILRPMAKYKIAWMPGDGVGNDVMEAARIVLDALGFDAEYVPADIGWELWCNEGDPLPKRTIDILKTTDCALFGAITSKPKEEALEELKPDLRDKGLEYFSPIVKLRQQFNLHTNLRPCKAYPGNPLNLRDDIDLVVFRENTEGSYGGVEFHPIPRGVFDALCANPKMKKFEARGLENLALSTRIMSRQGCESIVRQSFEYAKKHGRKSVTLVEKPNVLRETGGLMTRVAREVAKGYSGIPLWEANIDAMCMWLVRKPNDYDILVAENMFGDIISDLAAGLVGGLGFASAANIGDDYAVFEPTHGSAPKYAGQYKVNPMAMLLTVKLMFDWLGEVELASRLEDAIATVIRDGRVGTYDVGKSNTTLEVAEEVARKVANPAAAPAR